mmetsp:Transcript_12492/g.33025  ORF Transcript_12492/g.33025 Transcript_12492/m.33025 type:complete len:120 (-) Transcript_12492:1576-1935(-)
MTPFPSLLLQKGCRNGGGVLPAELLRCTPLPAAPPTPPVIALLRVESPQHPATPGRIPRERSELSCFQPQPHLSSRDRIQNASGNAVHFYGVVRFATWFLIYFLGRPNRALKQKNYFFY